jgi:hypothetical protein
MTRKSSLAGNSGFVRSLEPENAIDVDVSAKNWVCPESGGAYLYVNVTGNLVMKLIGDDVFHTYVVPSSYECRMAVKEISSSSTCTGIIALF